MKPHSVFLRKECILPERMDLLAEPVGKGWTLVEEITAPIFDTMIRRAGWHFMWGRGSCARRGFGRTQETATSRALNHALNSISRRFNAAELDSIVVTRYPGFHLARVAVQPRKIQQHTSLDIPNEKLTQIAPAL